MDIPQPTDTSPEADAVQLELLRQMPPDVRLEKALSLSCHLVQLAKDAIRRRYPQYSTDEVNLKFIELTYGNELAAAVRACRSGADS